MRRALFLLALLPVAAACTRTAVGPLGRPQIGIAAGSPVAPPERARPARGPAGVPVLPAPSAAPGAPRPALAITHNQDVLRFFDRFVYDEPQDFATLLARRARYESMILPHLSAHGVPAEMVHLALIESGFDPHARSRANAVGMWQFTESTARMEGLEVSAWVDDRRDPERATVAAARHLAALHDRFGSWYLAAAAYNGGSGLIERALAARAGGARGADSLFWLIQPVLPRETREYVPKLLAAALVGGNPSSFGITAVPPQPVVPVDTVLMQDAIELERAAALAGVDPALVRALNGRYVRGSTPPGRTAPLVLPSGAGERLLRAMASGQGQAGARPATDTVSHEVAAGETVWTIARRYGIQPHDLLRWNGLGSDGLIHPGDRLRLVPPQ